MKQNFGKILYPFGILFCCNNCLLGPVLPLSKDIQREKWLKIKNKWSENTQISEELYKESSAKFSDRKVSDQENYIPVFVGGKSFQSQLSKADIPTLTDHTELNIW